MSSPCGGCPPCCKRCVFSNEGATPIRIERVVVSKDVYGCVRPDGGAVVVSDGILGMMRDGSFHSVTPEGAAFLRVTGNPLAAYM